MKKFPLSLALMSCGLFCIAGIPVIRNQAQSEQIKPDSLSRAALVWSGENSPTHNPYKLIRQEKSGGGVSKSTPASRKQSLNNRHGPTYNIGIGIYLEQSHSLGAQILLVGGSKHPSSVAYIDMDVRSSDGKNIVEIRLRAQHADGTPAGQINGPGETDDTVHWWNKNDAYVPFISDQKPGKVSVWAEIIDSEKRVLATSNREIIEFIMPDIHVGYEEWKPSAKPGTWERKVYVGAATEALGFINLTAIPVQLKLAPAPNSGAVPQASYFSNAKGLTIGRASTKLDPDAKDVEFTATQYWSEGTTGSRQLNAYRVEATVDKARLFSPEERSTITRKPRENYAAQRNHS